MKTRFFLAGLSFAVFILFLLANFNFFALAQDEEYVWVLVDETDDRGIHDIEEIGAKLKKYEDSGIDSSLNNTGYYVDYSVRKTFAGMNSSAQASISTTPLEIKPETDVPLNLRVSITENEGYDGRVGDAGANARVVFCGNHSTPQDFIAPVLGGKPFYDYEFKSDSGESNFGSNEANGYPAYDTIVSGSLPAGTAHGDAIAVCAEVLLVGVRMGTVYHYRWLPSGSSDVSGVNKKYEVPKDENGNYIDSGVRVSDISGEVYVRRGDASSAEWEILNLDDVIYEGDMILTKNRNSRCALSLTDMTTFDLRPRSGIIINTRSEKESAFSILAGKVMVNLKKMIKDGSMNVEMSQGIAGARGTIFSLESDDKTSRVAVLEGAVEVKAKNGQVVMLGPNEKVIISDGEMGNKESYALKDELNFWEEETRNQIISDINERTGQMPDLETIPVIDSAMVSSLDYTGEMQREKKHPYYLYLSLIGVLLIVGVGFWFKKKQSINFNNYYKNMKKFYFSFALLLVLLSGCASNKNMVKETDNNSTPEPDTATVCTGMCETTIQGLCQDEIEANRIAGNDISLSILDEGHCQLACEAEWDDTTFECVSSADSCAQFLDTAPYCMEDGDTGDDTQTNLPGNCDKACRNYSKCVLYGDDISQADAEDAYQSCLETCSTWTDEERDCMANTSITVPQDCASQTACVLSQVRELMRQ